MCNDDRASILSHKLIGGIDGRVPGRTRCCCLDEFFPALVGSAGMNIPDVGDHQVLEHRSIAVYDCTNPFLFRGQKAALASGFGSAANTARASSRISIATIFMITLTRFEAGCDDVAPQKRTVKRSIALPSVFMETRWEVLGSPILPAISCGSRVGRFRSDVLA